MSKLKGRWGGESNEGGCQNKVEREFNIKGRYIKVDMYLHNGGTCLDSILGREETLSNCNEVGKWSIEKNAIPFFSY